jgi:hypothetical protein
MFHVHKWTKWEVYQEGNIQRYRKRYAGEWYSGPKEEPSIVGFAIYQKRTCEKCGKIEISLQEEFL